MIDVEDLPEEIVGIPTQNDFSTAATLDGQERTLVEKVYREANGNQSEAARRLGIGRDALRYKLKKFDLSC